MSYMKPQTGDSINDMMSNMIEFNKISFHLLEAKDEDEFEIWFEQAEQIDKRTLFLFLCDHKEEIPANYLNMVRNRFIFL